MLIYVFLIVIPVIWHVICLFGNIQKKSIKNISILLFFSIMILMVGFRSVQVGNDTSSYLYYYQRVGNAPFKNIFTVSSTSSTSMEHGFVLLEKLFYTLKAPFNVFMLFCSAVSLCPLMVLFYKESDNPLLVILLFACVSPFTLFFSGVRQSMAMGIGVISFFLARRKKLILFCLSVAIAFFIHESSIVLLLLYPLVRFKIKSKHLPFLFAICLVIVFFGGRILSVVSTFLGQYGRYGIVSTGAYRMIVLLFILLAFSFFISDEKKGTQLLFCIRNLLCLCLVLQCFTRHSFVATRVMYYFGIFLPLAIDKSVSNPKQGNKMMSDVITIAMVGFFFVYFFADAYLGNDGLNIYPYVPFWK